MEIIAAIKKLNKIFKDNGWPNKDIDEFVFDSFCELINNLDATQRSLIIELTERYSWISFNDYQSKTINVFEKVEVEKLKNLKKIYLFPISKSEDEGNIKSGPFLTYTIKGITRLLKKYVGIKLIIANNFDYFEKHNIKFTQSDALFLIDDYIGSGETLNDCISNVNKKLPVNNSMIYVIALATQSEIFEEINRKGISMYSDTILKKGITDYNDDIKAKEKKEIMLGIEKKIPGGSLYTFGHNQTEALITMIRTPDNTFPIFWKEYKHGNKKFLAPFSRDENI